MNRLLLQSHRRLITRVVSSKIFSVRFCASQIRRTRKARSSEREECTQKKKKRNVGKSSNRAEISEEENENEAKTSENRLLELKYSQEENEEKPSRRARVEEDEDEEPDPPIEEEKPRARFKNRRSKVAGSAMAEKFMEHMGDLAEVEGASMKAVNAFRMSIFVIGVPLYCISSYFSIFSGNFFIAWLFHKVTPMALWAPISSRQAENFLMRHPQLKRCKFSFKLPDSFRQCPEAHNNFVRSQVAFKAGDPSDRMKAIFAQRKAMLGNHIKYGMAYEMADNQRALIAVPTLFLGTYFLDAQAMLQTWGLWYDPAMSWLIPIAGASYMCRFLAPASFGRAVRAVHDDLLPGHAGDRK